MRIIIVADTPDQGAAPAVDAVPSDVVSRPQEMKPVPAAPAKPVPPPAKPVDKAAYDKLNALISQFKNAKPEDQSSWIDAVSNFRLHEATGGPTIQNWLASQMVGKTPEDAQSEAQILIWKALKNFKPGGEFIGWLKAALPHVKHVGLSDLSGLESDRFKKAFSYIRPYLLFLKNPEFPEAGSKPIDDDILALYDAGKMSEGEAAEAQAKRSHFNDKIDPKTGKTRVQFAREEFENKAHEYFGLNSTKGGNREMVFSEVKKRLKDVDPQYVQKMEDKNSDYWLTSDMYAPRGIGKEILNIAWDKARSGNDVSMDLQNPETEGRLSESIPSESLERFKARHKNPAKRENRPIIQDAPSQYMEMFEDPEDRERLEERLPQIQPFHVTMEGNKAKWDPNPEFEKTLRTIVEDLYGFGGESIPEGPKSVEQRTQEAFHAIGNFYADSLRDQRPENVRLKDLETKLAPLIKDPLILRHHEGSKLKGMQQYAFALREVMLDIMEYLANDKNYAMLKRQLGQGTVAEMKRRIRTAAILCISHLLNRG